MNTKKTTMTPSELPVVYRGTCSCGECVVETYTEPIACFNCHCSACRRFVKNDYATPAMFWLPAIKKTQGNVEYETTTALMGLAGAKRSKCSNCKDLGVFSLGIRAYTGLVFINPALLTRVDSSGDDSKLKPSVNIYYDSGLKKGEMGLPVTIHSDLGSLLYSSWMLLVEGMPQLFGLMLRLGWTKIISKVKRD